MSKKIGVFPWVDFAFRKIFGKPVNEECLIGHEPTQTEFIVLVLVLSEAVLVLDGCSNPAMPFFDPVGRRCCGSISWLAILNDVEYEYRSSACA
ncbi:MAG: hypothetical protein RJB11_1950, partial [Planctomycetota bacterium]